MTLRVKSIDRFCVRVPFRPVPGRNMVCDRAFLSWYMGRTHAKGDALCFRRRARRVVVVDLPGSAGELNHNGTTATT